MLIWGQHTTSLTVCMLHDTGDLSPTLHFTALFHTSYINHSQTVISKQTWHINHCVYWEDLYVFRHLKQLTHKRVHLHVDRADLEIADNISSSFWSSQSPNCSLID